MDLEYARRLTKADVLLWWSSSARPDMGGRQNDANSQQMAEDASDPEIVRTGAYTNACVEIDMRDLAIDAVMQSALVYELEGTEGGASIGFTEASHNLDEYAKGTAHAAVALGDTVLPTQIFAIVKQMVKAWWQDGAKADGGRARDMMDNFWRWVTAPTSALYDPALQRFLHGLMRKTFSQLLAELRRLGSEVIYANFNRIILATSKPSPAAAYAYANYVVSSVTSRELFKFVRLHIANFWTLYLQMDASNFAGIICQDPLDEDSEQKRLAKVEMRWLISALLPPALRQHFSTVVATFVQGLRDNKIKTANTRTPLRLLPNASQTQPDLQKRDEQNAARTFVTGQLTRTMLRVVEIAKKEYQDSAISQDPDYRESFVFPRLPGSALSTQKPVLEFVKASCAVFALAKELSVEVGTLRRNVLDLMGVREVSRNCNSLIQGICS